MGLKKYIDKWHIMLWDFAFHTSFKMKDTISKSKLWKDQEGGEAALKRLILRCAFITFFFNIVMCISISCLHIFSHWLFYFF